MTAWGTATEVERRRRIRISLWAYAYEIRDQPLVDDDTYDREARLVDFSVPTDHPRLDTWFRRHFTPDTGMWIRRHPELSRVAALYDRLISPRPVGEFDELLG